jgi:hypothetical protein
VKKDLRDKVMFFLEKFSETLPGSSITREAIDYAKELHREMQPKKRGPKPRYVPRDIKMGVKSE